MPRGKKSSAVARAVDAAKLLLAALTEVNEEYASILADAEAYRKIKPLIKSIAGDIEPPPPPPSQTGELPPPSKRITRKQKKSNDSETSGNGKETSIQPNS